MRALSFKYVKSVCGWFTECRAMAASQESKPRGPTHHALPGVGGGADQLYGGRKRGRER